MSWIAVGIGAAVGAGAGAIYGSQKGGDEVWKDALIGGALGAVGGVGVGALGAGAGAAGAGAAEAGALGAGAGAAEAGSGLALGGAGLETGGAMGGAGIVGGTEAGVGGAGAFGGASGFGTVAPAALPGSGAAFGTTGAATVGEVGGAGAGAGGAGGTGLAGWWGGLNPAMKAGIMGAGTLGLGALINQDNKKYGVPQQETYSGPLSQFHYSPSNYTPTYATPNVYKPRYAEGGITALAAGGDPMNPIDNSIYPQSQQEHTNFATSTQYPNSMKSAMAADYDARINPMTGAELPIGMAEGGFARPVHPEGYDMEMSTGKWVPSAKKDDLGSLAGLFGGTSDKVSEEDAATNKMLLAILGGQNQSNMARGGIASLGGYSDGGQLLKGPGDGVSDSIPASIGARQPARLADGEFVVPARAVSELGNGSTEAGAKQLYAMLDRIDNKRKKGKGLAYQAHPKKMMPA